MQIGSAGAANFFKPKADKAGNKDSRAKKRDFADLVGRPSSRPPNEVGSKTPPRTHRELGNRPMEARPKPSRERDTSNLRRKIDEQQPKPQLVEAVPIDLAGEKLAIPEAASKRISQTHVNAGTEELTQAPVEMTTGKQTLIGQALVPKRSPSLDKLGMMLKPLVKLSPQLNFLSGHHSGIAVDDLPKLISSGSLIKFGLQNEQEEQLMTEKKPVHAWLAASGLGGNWEHHAPHADIDLQEEVAGKDFFKALGIDPQRVVVELVRLKQSLAGPGGLTEYVELNKFGKKQGFGLVQPYGETEAKPSLKKAQQNAVPVPVSVPLENKLNQNQNNLNQPSQARTPSLASRIKEPSPLKTDGLTPSTEDSKTEIPVAPLVPLPKQTPRMARTAGAAKFAVPSLEPNLDAASPSPLKSLTHAITDANPMDSMALDKNASVKLELDTSAGHVGDPFAEASVNGPSLKPMPKTDFAIKKDLFPNSAAKPGLESVEIEAPRANTFRAALEQSISNLPKKAPMGLVLERNPSMEILHKPELEFKSLAKEGDGFLAEVESLPQDTLAEGGTENSFGESGKQDQAFSQTNTKFAPIPADSFASSEQRWMESLDGAASSSPQLDSYKNEFTQKVLQKAQVLVNKQQSALSFDFGTGDNKIQIGLSLHQNSLNLKIAANDSGLRDSLGGEIEQLQAALSQQNIRLNEVEMGKTMTSEHSHQQSHMDQRSFNDQRPSEFNEQFEEIKSLWENSSSSLGRNTRLPQWPTSAKLAGVVDPTVKGHSSIAVRI